MNTTDNPIADQKTIVNTKGLIRLLEFEKYESEWKDKLEELGVQIDWGYGSPDILQIVFDLLGFPEDEDTEEGFCRDWLRDGPEGPMGKVPSPEIYLNWLLEQKKLFQDNN